MHNVRRIVPRAPPNSVRLSVSENMAAWWHDSFKRWDKKLSQSCCCLVCRLAFMLFYFQLRESSGGSRIYRVLVLHSRELKLCHTWIMKEGCWFTVTTPGPPLPSNSLSLILVSVSRTRSWTPVFRRGETLIGRGPPWTAAGPGQRIWRRWESLSWWWWWTSAGWRSTCAAFLPEWGRGRSS